MRTMRRCAGLACLALGIMLAACVAPPVPDGPVMACTLIGCESQVVFEIGTDIVSGTTYEVEACIDGLCESATVAVPPAQGQAMGAGVSGSLTLDPQQDLVTFRLSGDDYSGMHAVSLTLAGPDGQLTEMAAETEFERSQPNGPGCEPVCWQALVRI
jgi:hypothetical protein